MHGIPTIIEGDTLLVTVVGGIIIGFGMGLALRNGRIRWNRYAAVLLVNYHLERVTLFYS